jgi:hypothetical protein
MKLVPILASIVTGFAMLATVGSASASATEFNLTGTFASTDLAGTTGLAGGSFNGTYSYSGGAVPATSTELLSSFSINLLIGNTIVDTFNSNNPGNSGSIVGNSGYDQLLLQNTDTGLQLLFPTNFDGTGSLTTNGSVFYSSSPSSGPSSGLLFVTSATSSPISQSVPEPSMIAGTIAAGAALMMARLKKQKAFQAA